MFILIKLDTIKPTVVISSNLPKMMIEKNNYALRDYVSVTYGISSGDYSCSSSINGTITNTLSLSKGVHTITCIAESNNGLSSSSSIIIAIVNNDYVRNTANEKLVTITTTGNSDREYYKTNDIIALTGLIYYSSSNWYGPILVSNINSKATNYYTRNNYVDDFAGYHTFTYLGETWYVSGGAAFYHYDSIASIETTLVTISSNCFTDEVEAARSLIDLALK